MATSNNQSSDQCNGTDGGEKNFNYYFRQDILRLFDAFDKNNFLKYSEFVTLWDAMKFNQIFMLSKFYPFEYREFTRDTLKIIVEYLYDDEYNFEVRTAALYTLYAFHSHQTHQPRLKIPVTSEQWIQILQYINICCENEHIDIEYIFRTLLHSNAFEFCSSQELKGVYNLKSDKMKKSVKTLSNVLDTKSKSNDQDNQLEQFKQSVFEDDLTTQMGVLHEAYLQIKEDLVNDKTAGSTASAMTSYILPNFKDLLDENLLEDLKTNQETKSSNSKQEASLKRMKNVFERIHETTSTKSDYADITFYNSKSKNYLMRTNKKKINKIKRMNRNLDDLLDVKVEADETNDNGFDDDDDDDAENNDSNPVERENDYEIDDEVVTSKFALRKKKSNNKTKSNTIMNSKKPKSVTSSTNSNNNTSSSSSGSASTSSGSSSNNSDTSDNTSDSNDDNDDDDDDQDDDDDDHNDQSDASDDDSDAEQLLSLLNLTKSSVEIASSKNELF